MSIERRESLRTEVELPLQWLACGAHTPPDQLCKLFGLPGFIRFHGKLGELGAEFSSAVRDVRDPATVGALEVLNAKLGVFEEALYAETAIPPEQLLELGTEGVGFDSTEPVADGAWLAMHLVLPTAYHVLCNARVTHCQEYARQDATGYRIGAQLCNVDTAAAKRLTRFVISAH